MAYSNFYNALLKIRIWYLYSFTFLCAGFSVAGWWYFLYQPTLREQVQLQQQLDQMHVQLNELRKSEKSLRTVAQSIDALKHDDQKNNGKKSHTIYKQECLSSIIDFAIEAGIVVDMCRLSGQREESWCNVNTIMADFKGTFDQMIAFFDSLKNMKQKLVDVVHCELIHTKENLFSLHAIIDFYCV